MRKLRFALLGAVIAAMLPAAVQAQSRQVTIVNHSGQSLYNLYIEDGRRAPADRLGKDDIVGDGEQRTFTLDNECTSNLQAVFKDGRTVTLRGVDICREPKWEFGGYGKNVLTFGMTKEAGAVINALWTEYACTVAGDRMVLRVEPHNQVKLSMNGRPVEVRKAEQVQPPLDQGYLSIDTPAAHYELYEGSGEERTTLFRYLPGETPFGGGGTPGVCTTTYSRAMQQERQRR